MTVVSIHAAAKSLQSCPTLCDPIDGSPPGSPVPGILQQEHWSGLPFPSPMHESEKWKWSRSVMADPQQPHGLGPSRLLCPRDFPGKSTGVGCHCLLPSLPYILPFHTVHGVLKARMLKWFAISFSSLPTKICIVKAMFFSSSHVWMWEFNPK